MDWNMIFRTENLVKKRNLLVVVVCLMMCIGLETRAQNSNFQDILIQSRIKETDDMKLDNFIEATFILNTPFWLQIYEEVRLTNKGNFINPSAAMRVIYTYQQEALNYMELRPWIGIHARHPFITDVLFLYNTTRVEFRNFIYFGSLAPKQKGRLRTKVGGEYFIHRNTTKNTSWSIDTNYEWFFLNAPAPNENYSNSSTFSISLCRKFSNGRTLNMKFQRNSFLLGNNTTEDGGNSFTFEYDL